MERFRTHVLSSKQFRALWGVVLIALIVACGGREQPTGLVEVRLELPTLTSQSSDLAPQGIPFDENGNPVVTYLRVEIFDANDNPVTPTDAPQGFVELTDTAPSATLTLPVGSYTFVSYGYDGNDLVTWIAYGEDTVTLSGNAQTVQLFPKTLLESATLRPSAPISVVVPGQQLDLMLTVASPLSPYTVPFDDFEVVYNLSAVMGSEVASSKRGIRLNVTTTPTTPTFEMSGDASGWRNVNNEPTPNSTVTATFSLPFAGQGGSTTIVSDLEAPTLTFGAPDTSSSPLTLTGSADDNYGIDRVQLYDGPVLIASSHSDDLSDPSVATIVFNGTTWSTTWTPSSGSSELVAIAIDSSGNQSEATRSVSGGSSGDPGDPLDPEDPPTQNVTTIEQQLRELGLDIDGLRGTPRQIGNGGATTASLSTAQFNGGTASVDDSYAPFGARVRLAPKEIFAAGIGSECPLPILSASASDQRFLAVNMYDPAQQRVAPNVQCTGYESGGQWAPTFGPDPDASLLQPGTQSTRTALSGDLDGDSFEEGGSVDAWYNASIGNWMLRGFRYEHGADFDPSSPRTSLFGMRQFGTWDVVDIAALSSDMTGNGLDDLVVGVLKNEYLALIPFPQTAPGQFDERAGNTQNNIDTTDLSGTLSVRMATGNIDTDRHNEFVVVIRAWGGALVNGQPTGTVRYYIYDHLEPGTFDLVEIASGTLTFTSPGTSRTENVVTADVAIGDYDGDGIDEIAFAGIGTFPGGNSSFCGDYTYTYRILDDVARGLAEIVSSTYREGSPACDGSVSTAGVVYSVLANTLDYDGDYTRELQANERILKVQGDQLVEIATVDVHPSLAEQHFSEATVAITVGDVDKDARDNVISYTTYDGALRFSGLGTPIAQIEFLSSEFSHPVLQAFDSDLDGTTIEYVPASHRLEFSEPLILAALAAPPYDTAYGQDAEDATTAYGTSTTQGGSSETTLSFNTSVGVGVSLGGSIGFFEFSAEYKATFDAWMNKSAGTAYETTFTDTFTTAGRDAVVFTSIPYDLYDYIIVASDDASEVGDTLTFSFPRTPYTRVVSTSYFNARVPADRLKIDERVFRHTFGDVSSYMSAQEKNDLRDRVRNNTTSSVSNLFLSSGIKTVGEGATSTGTAITLSEESFYSEAVGASRTHSVSLTAGVAIAEFSVGEGEERSMSVSAGNSTEISSEVPGITVNDLSTPNAVYSYGMMTYMQRLPDPEGNPGQAFQVINYWVE